MLRKWLCQADVRIQINPIDPILIKSGYATIDGPDMVPVSTFRNGEHTYYFPGSSLKGVLRSHFERIARTLRQGSVCIPYYDPGKPANYQVPVAEEQESFGCGFLSAQASRPNTTATHYWESCAACRMFGSLRFAGRFSISDAYPLECNPPVASQRNGVGIDRFTGGTVGGVLFDLKVLEGGTFESQIRLLNFELWQLAALNFLLSDLQDEMISLGSGRSRGLGRISAKVVDYKLSYVQPPGVLAALGELATDEERIAYGLFSFEPDHPVDLPESTRRGLRHQYDLTSDWQARLEPLAPSLEAFLQWHTTRGVPPRDR